MPILQLRVQVGQSSQSDLQVEVQDKTLEYLLRSDIPSNARVSTYLDRDWPRVEAAYGELVVDGCKYDHLVLRVIPGSRMRTGIILPGPMKMGEQLTLEIERRLKLAPDQS